ncbi:ISLre2-like element ISMoth2 family transposase [Neomoorella thermoacetica]|nr:ISLre2-like element ISMoth2 family transposase [Moorella thermoacetica]AKX95079.1 hypothetical protein MOTHE_c22960 [Moorella thermoacetica]AKX97705.1 hypothetical protein MOTHA_c23690 [Moorella thermoacetica]OIQ52679.1 hypothetical protein MOCA_26690 [Moorella thermoacetica]QDA01525.1 hypothetical protein MothHH_02413 [Moorella thermoacetica]
MVNGSTSTATIISLLDGIENFNTLEEVILQIARRLLVAVLEALDDTLMPAKPKGYKIAGFRYRTITCLYGDITFKRRLYVKATRKKKRGEGRFLLDEALNLRQGKRLTGRLLKLAVSLATRLPFRQAAEIMAEAGMGQLSHMTIHSEVKRNGLEQKELQEALRNNLFMSGEEPQGKKKKVPVLFIEADGIMIPLQRSKQDRIEVKVGIVYEGWIEKGNARHLKNPRVVMGIYEDGEQFWEALTTEIARYYEIDEKTIYVVNGDGASWVQKTAKEQLPGAIVQLDRYHLHRDIRQAYGNETAQGLMKTLAKGQEQVFLDTLEALIEEAPNRKNKQQCQKVYDYCQRYRDNLLDYRLRLPRQLEGQKLYGMGVAETTVDKKIAIRMKKRGMSWSEAGATAMVALLMLKANGELAAWLEKKMPQVEKNPAKVVKEKKISKEDVEEWLRKRVPALVGPEAGTDWVKYTMRQLTRISGAIF